MFGEEQCKKYLFRLLFCLTLILLVYVFFKYVFHLLAPFFIAFCVAFAVRPVKRYFCNRLRLPSTVSAITAVSLVLGGLLSMLFLLARGILSELASIYSYLTTETNLYPVLIRSVNDLVDKLAYRLESVFYFIDFPPLSPSDRLEAIANEFIPHLTDQIGAFLKDTAISLPNVLIFVAITTVASFYFSADIEKICAFISGLFPKDKYSSFIKAKNGLFDTAYKYAKAYLLLLIITFTELCIGFSLLGLKYVFSLAFVISVIDILPVLGTGTVLLPWSAISFAIGDTYMGTGILTLYLSITIIRQFLEPRIVGKSIGLYPPLTLIGMYVGIKLFGITGLFLVPIAFVAAKKLLFDTALYSDSR